MTLSAASPALRVADFRLLVGELLLVGVDDLIEVLRQIAAHTSLEFGAQLRVERLDRAVPRFACSRGARSSLPPGCEKVVRNNKRLIAPVQGLARAGDFARPLRVAVRLLRSGMRRQAETNCRLAADQRRLVGFLRGVDRVEDRLGVVPVDVDRVPARRLEAGDLVDIVGEGGARRSVIPLSSQKTISLFSLRWPAMPIAPGSRLPSGRRRTR